MGAAAVEPPRLQSLAHAASDPETPRHAQDQEYSEVSLVLRLPRWRPAPPAAAAAGAGAPRRPAGDTALGVDGIELREQSHEEALLSTIGGRPGCRRFTVWGWGAASAWVKMCYLAGRVNALQSMALLSLLHRRHGSRRACLAARRRSECACSAMIYALRGP